MNQTGLQQFYSDYDDAVRNETFIQKLIQHSIDSLNDQIMDTKS